MSDKALGDLPDAGFVDTGDSLYATRQGNSRRVKLGSAAARTLDQDVGSTDRPQFTGVNIGDTGDTEITRSEAGVLAVDAVEIGRVGEAATLTALKALSANAYDVAIMHDRSTAGDGGGGVFRWNVSDLSTEVTNDSQNGVYVPPDSDTTGASGAWVRIVDGEAYFTEWFGAAQDGSDDATAIDAALSLASSEGVGKVRLRDGTYTTTRITMQSGVDLEGASWNTILQLADSTNAPILDMSDITDVTVRNLMLDGNRTNQSSDGEGAHASGTAARLRFFNIQIKSTYHQGLLLQSVDDVKVIGCRIEDIGSHGVIANSSCTDVIIANNTVKNFGRVIASRQGIEAGQSSSIIVTGNTVEGDNTNSHTGISIAACTDVVVGGNTVKNTTNYGIEVADDTNYFAVGDNIVQNADNHGIAIVGSTGGNPDRGTVTGNVSRDNGKSGIFVSNGSGSGTLLEIVVDGNVCFRNGSAAGDYGISMVEVNHGKLNNNMCRINQDAGIFVDISDEITIVGNEVTNNNQSGAGSSAGIRVDNDTGESNYIISLNGTSAVSVKNTVDVNTNNTTSW